MYQSEELLTYFTSFLADITHIIDNIKRHTYQMLGLTQPVKRVNECRLAVPSLISSTHCTYDALKMVEALLAGVSRSKGEKREKKWEAVRLKTKIGVWSREEMQENNQQ